MNWYINYVLRLDKKEKTMKKRYSTQFQTNRSLRLRQRIRDSFNLS